MRIRVLMQVGTSFVSAIAQGFCFGMMQGITSTNKYYQVTLGKKRALFCTPEQNIKNGQAARIVLKYLKEHPEKLHENDSVLAIEAFMEAFPCE